MEENKNEQAENEQETTQETAEAPETATETPAEKTFTQAEVDELINKRLARERARKTASDTQKISEIDAVKKEIAELKAKNACYRAGVRDECLNDVMTLANANVDDETGFEEALEAVLKRYPNLVKAAPITTGKKIENKQDEPDLTGLRKAFGLK